MKTAQEMRVNNVVLIDSQPWIIQKLSTPNPVETQPS